ncbi:ISL3 family transposase [Halanaerobium sp. Z-7514]|uniref:ISL3 family transposase n=2 Tax=Halanaerobium TaxID=2330 RepID=A0AAW4X2M8_9FIRM|nr:ISL3 family transposase [Halanaerobium polyolivorans]MCC3146073.1 ISL3 family transposase [Halanaerobium polyolivorans]
MHNKFITDLMNLPDLVATDLIQTEEYLVFVADYRKNYVKCPVCGKKVDKVHDRKVQVVQDTPLRDKKVAIRLLKKRYRCSHCGKRAIPKRIESITKYSRKTERFKMNLLKQTDSRDYSRVAKEHGLSYTSIQNSVRSKLDTLIKEAQLATLDEVEAISIDEFAIKKKHKYAVALTDPINNKLIDILTSRKKDDLIKYFNTWPKKLKEQIKYFSMDMWSPYKAVAETVFPNAKIVVDKFHLVTTVNNALDKLRIKEQDKQTAANRKKFYKSRLTLLMAGEDLDDNGHQRLIEIFKLSPALEKAWELKEEFRDLLQIPDVKESIEALNHWYKNVSQAKLNLFYKAKGTLKRWEQHIINYFKTRITNGFAEGLNNKIKLIKRIGYGVPKVENLKRRVFLSLLSI